MELLSTRKRGTRRTMKPPTHPTATRRWTTTATLLVLATALFAETTTSTPPSPPRADSVDTQQRAPDLATGSPMLQRFDQSSPKIPMSFEANQGQADASVKFLARGRGYTLFLSSTQSVLRLRSAAEPVLRLSVMGGNPYPEIQSLDPLPGRVNYFAGADPQRWRTNIPTYAKILCREVYPGIDLVYYGQQG